MKCFIFQRLDGLEYFCKQNKLSRNHHLQLSNSRASNQCNCDSRINSHPSKVSIFVLLSDMNVDESQDSVFRINF